METYFRRYLRDEAGKPRGLFLAEKVNEKVFVSWSMCHKNDTFSKARAFQIASARLQSLVTSDRAARTPFTMAPEQCSFVNTACKFFKVDSACDVVQVGTQER